MNILMLTNTYLPFVGGVERSVEQFSRELRGLGHGIKIVAPSYRNFSETDHNVVRVAAIQQFNGTDFSVQFPIPGAIKRTLKSFVPDIIHSHHPFMLGDSALRLAAKYRIPIVFTFHTYYERYTHYVPGNSPAIKRFVTALATGYANLCDVVIAPSYSVAAEIRRRGVASPIEVVPTGITLAEFSAGDGREFRKMSGIPQEAFLVGFISRLAQEKNIQFLIEAVSSFLLKNKRAHFLVVGDGPCRDLTIAAFTSTDLADRFHYCSTLHGKKLIDAYHALDVFAFASCTETQGLVLTEALASGVPVVALDVEVVAEIVEDGCNGKLVREADTEAFSNALGWICGCSPTKKRRIKESCYATACAYDSKLCAVKVEKLYKDLTAAKFVFRERKESSWEKTMRLIKAEFELVKNMTRATGAAMGERREGGWT